MSGAPESSPGWFLNSKLKTTARDTVFIFAMMSAFTMGASYDQKDAEGFIKILGLPARVRAQVLGKHKHKELAK